jgi:hypothetical protein
MKQSDFEKVAIEVLGSKYFDMFGTETNLMGGVCAIKLFTMNESESRRALIVREFLTSLHNNGFMKWEKEEDEED